MGKYAYDPLDSKRKRLNRVFLRCMIDEIKMSNFCQVCGIEDPNHPEIFDFDHQHDKKECISNCVQQSWGWGRAFAEIKKCTILCSNCHRIKTKEDRKSNITHFILETNQLELF
jgi:hypothetical protein